MPADTPQDLHIGEVARRTGRSVHTIRWYEAQGLIPSVIRDKGGRRTYSEYHIGWLDFMERLRFTGMPVAQMREYAALVKEGGRALKQRRAFLAQHQARVQETIARWTKALAPISAKVEFYDEWVASGERPTLEPHKRLRRSKSAFKRPARP
jgi:DNA-binding transcriptional MerR regulator